MLAKRFAEIIVLLSIVTSLSTKTLAQNTQDCRTKKDIPLISGHWKDDQTGKEVDITYLPSSPKVVATYSETHNCPNPDEKGKPVPSPIDFEGTAVQRKIEGTIHVCRWRTDNKHPTAYTYATGEVDVKLWMTEDGMGLRGYWNNPDTHKDEDVSFTRLDKPYYPTSKFDIVEAGANAKIYEQPSTESKVSSTPEPGTRLMIYATETDEKGNATWYLVTDLRYSLGRENYGWIRLGQVKCKSSNKTISQGQQSSPAGSTSLVR